MDENYHGTQCLDDIFRRGIRSNIRAHIGMELLVDHTRDYKTNFGILAAAVCLVFL